MSLVEFDRYSDAALAHIVRGRLEAAGIQAFCFDTGMNMAESVPMMFKVRVMVLADELEAARRTIASEEMMPVERTGEEADFDEQHFLEPERESHGDRQRRLARLLLLVLFGPFLILPLAMCMSR